MSKNENPLRIRLVFKSECIAKESQCEIDYLWFISVIDNKLTLWCIQQQQLLEEYNFCEGLKYFRTKNYTIQVLIVVVTTMEKFHKS